MSGGRERKAVGPGKGAVLSDSMANKRKVNDSQVVADVLLLMRRIYVPYNDAIINHNQFQASCVHSVTPSLGCVRPPYIGRSMVFDNSRISIILCVLGQHREQTHQKKVKRKKNCYSYSADSTSIQLILHRFPGEPIRWRAHAPRPHTKTLPPQ